MRLQLATKRQIIEKHRKQYEKMSKKQRSDLLNSLAATIGLSRNHLARTLRNGYVKPVKGQKDHRRRKPMYGMQHKRLLAYLWELLYYPSSRRLKAALPDVVASIKELLPTRFEPTIIEEVLKMSHGTMDRLLRHNRRCR